MARRATRFRLGTALAFAVVLVMTGGCASPPNAATPSPTIVATPGATVEATSTPGSTVIPTATEAPTPTSSPSADTSGAPTRLIIARLRIDLPVIRLPASGIHDCGVALWWVYPGFVAPGRSGSVYLLAHSRPGMFLPLLDASLVDGGRSLIGMNIQLYSSADWVFTYTVIAVRRHVTSSGTSRLTTALAATGPELWLQTSEGPLTTSSLLQVASRLASAAPANQAAAHPAPHPYICM